MDGQGRLRVTARRGLGLRVAAGTAEPEAASFSAANRERRAHYHHINEQAIEVWDNLFSHMSFPFFVGLNGMGERASRLCLSANLGRRLAAGAVA